MEIKTLLLIISIFLLFNALTLLSNTIINNIYYSKKEKKDNIIHKLNKECYELNKELLELRLKKKKNK